MKSVVRACMAASVLIAGGCSHTPKPVLRKGVAVELPAADHAVEVPAADEENATVVAMTADGKLFIGAERTEPVALSRLRDRTIYVKVDARAPFQKVLAVFDALHGKSVVLLSAPENGVRQGYVPPYGTKLILSR
jgi:biopolymer transport protein ExbD